MKKYFFVFCIFLIFLSFFSCTRNKNKIKDLFGTKSPQEEKINSIYRFYSGQREGFNIWIVDGSLIRRSIFKEFIYGGNDERYPFVPDNEIWIDNTISSEEFETTVAHEINERKLMEKYKMAYFDAHDSSLALELQMRRNYKKTCEEHESGLKEITPIDFDSTQEITDIPEKIKLKNIYRVPLGERNGIKIWIVDGYNVRRDIYPDFGFSGNDRAYHFIPEKEIWIDGEISCEETEYSISQEMKERDLMDKGLEYDSAYTNAIQISDKMREDQLLLCNAQKMISKPEQVARDTGIKK